MTGRLSEDSVEVGRIHSAHGVRGEVSVEPYSDVAERFAPGAELTAVGGRGAPGRSRGVVVRAVRPHRGALLVRFDGVEDRDAAAQLAGATLEVPRAAVPDPPAETWYYFQLVGCRCHDRTQGDLGEVIDVVEDGGGLLLDVRDRERRLLIPFVRALVEEVDPEAKRIVLALPEGFVEACASKS